jgi:hypothetical protein
MMPQHEQLPSGKTIIRQYDDKGQLASEMHAHGAVDIALMMEFADGTKVGEMYVVKDRLASRKRYEQAREQFPDMPVPDSSLEDASAELIKAANKERRLRQRARKRHQPDPKSARQIDAFCLALMKRGKREDAVTWVKSSQNALGELSPAASQRLVEKLLRLGCRRIHACEIAVYDDGAANTGHLVVELPAEAALRKAVLQEIDRLAAAQGYSGELDDGQRYAYLKLD